MSVMSHSRISSKSSTQTLAPREQSSPYRLLSCLERLPELPLLLTDSRLGPDNFQSNALDELNLANNLPGLVPSALGLGISYDLFNSKKIPFNVGDEIEDAYSVTSSRSRPLSPSGSVYDLLEYPEPLCEDLHSLFESQLPTSWSSSSNNSGYSCPDHLASMPDSLGQQSLAFQRQDSAPWSLESISAATVLALRHMTPGSHSSLSSISELPSSEDVFIKTFVDSYPWPMMPHCATGATSVPDTEMDHRLRSWKEPSLAINPANIMADISQDLDVDYSYILFSPKPEAFCLPESCASDPSWQDGELVDEERRSPYYNGDIHVDPNNAVATSKIGTYYHVYPAGNKDQETSDYESSSSESSPFPSPQQKKRSRRSMKPLSKSQAKKHPIGKTNATDISLVKAESLITGEPDAEDGPEVAADETNLGTPVFDAHRGIDLDDLKSRAARYRLRNPGRDYDNTWLVSFAGKLSKQGKLLDDFRCYVLGCDQVNKRRDHILIHVGSHLDQRPFKCRYWYVTTHNASFSDA